MPARFHGLHFNVADRPDEDLRSVKSRPLGLRGGGPARPTDDTPTFNSEEAAARFYLEQLLDRDDRPVLRGLTAKDRPAVVPDMQLKESRRSGLTGTWMVSFVQTKASIPIFGSRAVVELDRNRELLAVDASLADVGMVSPMAAYSPSQAIEKVATLAQVSLKSLGQVEAPELTYYHDEAKDAWHLAYFFRNVPAAPPDFFEGSRSHGHGRRFASLHPELHYLVDAHECKVLLYWSAHPGVDVPCACSGDDEDGVNRKFWGRVLGQQVFELHDVMRNIRTFDFGMQDVDTAVPPANPINGPTASFDDRAAVSAHFHATRVYDFYKSVLLRDSIDDKGMALISYVNCILPAEQQPPEWHNAVWWKNSMWYGQSNESGRLRSFARFLDVIGHELTHGVTEFTSDLVYKGESGALNESFSDILGVMIHNWDASQPQTGGDVGTWDWEIGKDLSGGLPLRDMRDPTRTGDPDHMNQFLKTTKDHGGVHTNSNIHNKAAYNVLIAPTPGGERVFSPKEVAVLYYLSLTRLGRLATFSQTLATLLNVAAIYFAGDAKRQEKLDAIRGAYQMVGIQ